MILLYGCFMFDFSILLLQWVAMSGYQGLYFDGAILKYQKNCKNTNLTCNDRFFLIFYLILGKKSNSNDLWPAPFMNFLILVYSIFFE